MTTPEGIDDRDRAVIGTLIDTADEFSDGVDCAEEVLEALHDALPALRKLATQAPVERPPSGATAPSAPEGSHRWNIEGDERGLRVCFNDHEKGDRCRYVEFVPATDVVRLRQHLAEAKAVVARLAVLVWSSEQSDLRREAVERGHAEYVVDADGDAVWRWKEGR